MRFYFESIPFRTGKRFEVIDVTSEVNDAVRRSGVKRGLLNIWSPHTTAAVTVNEHDPDLWEDLLSTLKRLVPVEGRYLHNAKYRWIPGEQNAHAHILSSLFKPDVTVPVEEGRARLGSWQSILFVELDGPRNRRVEVTVLGE